MKKTRKIIFFTQEIFSLTKLKRIDNIIKEKNVKNGGIMILYPKLYLNNVKEINISILNKYKLKGLILDIDNTLIDYNKNLIEGAKEWAETLKAEKIKLCILSNSNHKNKVENVAKELDIPYIYFAQKPLKKGFNKAKEMLELQENEIGVVGDQILTDVLGANKSNMFPILVKPIEKKDIFITKIKRPIEQIIINKYLK